MSPVEQLLTVVIACLGVMNVVLASLFAHACNDKDDLRQALAEAQAGQVRRGGRGYGA